MVDRPDISSAPVAFAGAKDAMGRTCCPLHVTVATSDPDYTS